MFLTNLIENPCLPPCMASARMTRGGEYYLTDVPGILRAQGHHVGLVDEVPQEDVLSINTLDQLAKVDEILRHRLAHIATGGQA